MMQASLLRSWIEQAKIKSPGLRSMDPAQTLCISSRLTSRTSITPGKGFRYCAGMGDASKTITQNATAWNRTTSDAAVVPVSVQDVVLLAVCFMLSAIVV